jgi:small-conductance mechanosensitive channel
MATSSTPANPRRPHRSHVLGRTRLISLVTLAVLFVLCIVLSWNARIPMGGSRVNRPDSMRRGVRRTLVDLSPWQTAQTLSALAVTAEEAEFAHDALRLADHEVDQAFASALRQAALQSAHRPRTPAVQAAEQRVQQMQDLVAQDQNIVQILTDALAPKAGLGKTESKPDSDISDDLEVMKAQLGLDSDELVDAQRDLNRTSGDNSAQIKEELAAHEAAQTQYDNAVRTGTEVAAVSVRQRGTLAARLSAWFAQIDRTRSITQAQQQALSDAAAWTKEHDALEAKADAEHGATNSAADRTARLAVIGDRSAERQILSIYDDRIQTSQQLASVYGKWAAQVQLQHGIVGRLILQSFSVILLVAIGALLCDVLVRQIMDRAALERRQMLTLRSVLSLGIQVLGGIFILLIIFGVPQETPTILGLATAALTIALQDFILAFLGWFILMGKHGMHVGDWVEINGVGGEVTEVGLFSTSLLETGTLEDKGHPTGRRITFMNGFAIRGKYFNFTTTGQWMWDEISVTIPAVGDTSLTVERIHQAVLAATEENAGLAEQEWKRGARGQGLGRFSAAPVVNLRPSSSGIDTQVRYVTRASERFELRNRLYQRIVVLLQHPEAPSVAPAS